MNKDNLKKANQFFDKLQHIESLLGKFYGQCASSFPEDKLLWEKLEKAEEHHARLAAELKKIMSGKEEKFELWEFNIFALKTYSKGIELQILRLEKGEIQRRKALFIAQNYKNTLVEKKFYATVKSDDPEYKNIKNKIEKEAEFHLKKLNDYIKAKL